MEWMIDLSELNGLRRWYGKQPKLMQQACAAMLNQFAFGTRSQAIKRIDALMTVRNPKFVASRIQVSKANGARPINSQVARTGSKATARFTGWTEQEFGTKPQMNRMIALMGGRGGNIQKQARPSARLKPGRQVVRPTDPEYNPKGGKTNVAGFFAMARRKKENRLLFVKKYKTFYKRRGNKFEAAQTMPRHKIKRERWLRQARAIYFQQTDLGRLWENTVHRFVPPPTTVK